MSQNFISFLVNNIIPLFEREQNTIVWFTYVGSLNLDSLAPILHWLISDEFVFAKKCHSSLIYFILYTAFQTKCKLCFSERNRMSWMPLLLNFFVSLVSLFLLSVRFGLFLSSSTSPLANNIYISKDCKGGNMPIEEWVITWEHMCII